MDLAQIDKALGFADDLARVGRDIEQARKVAEPLSKLVIPNIGELNAATALARASHPFIDYDPVGRIGEQLRNSSVANVMSAVGTIADAVNSISAYTDWMIAVPAHDSWRPVLMRWAEPSTPAVVADYMKASQAISDAVRPLAWLASTEVLRETHQAPLRDLRVLIENPIQIPELDLPLIGELFPDVPFVPGYPPDSPSSEPSPPEEQPEPESTPPSDQITKEDLEEAIRRAVEQSKTPLRVRLRDGIVVAVVTKIAVDYVQVDDHVVRVALKGAQVVVDGVYYFLPYLP